jgi:choline dehydrogenase
MAISATLGKDGVGHGPPFEDIDWGYRSQPLWGRAISLGRGKVVGGCSMINGCIGVRGRPEDFTRWEAAGAAGWGWEQVRPFYERVDEASPLQQWPRDEWLPVQELVISGFEALGFRYFDDMNAPDAWDGAVGPWPQNRRLGMRQGTLVTYIRAARGRPNFELRPQVLVDRVLFEGDRATGVRYIGADGRPVEVFADRVVLSAGTYGSPPILLRSGIGPSDRLAAAGIACRHELPVGQGLMDHAHVKFLLDTPPAVARMFGPGMPAVARGEDWYVIPVAHDEEVGICATSFVLATHDGDGTIDVPDASPASAPIVNLNMEHNADGGYDTAWEAFHALLETEPFRAQAIRARHDGLTLRQILEARMSTGCHPAGGCRIGEVVDSDLRVLGLDGLYVADASVFPRHVSNNPERTCMMVGEYAAAKLRLAAAAAH